MRGRQLLQSGLEPDQDCFYKSPSEHRNDCEYSLEISFAPAFAAAASCDGLQYGLVRPHMSSRAVRRDRAAAIDLQDCVR